jgi:hypothetical protein
MAEGLVPLMEVDFLSKQESQEVPSTALLRRFADFVPSREPRNKLQNEGWKRYAEKSRSITPWESPRH